MKQAALMVLWCGLITVGAMVAVVVLGNRGWHGIDTQLKMDRWSFWFLFGDGIGAGVILAMANALGPWMQLKWRTLTVVYSCIPVGISLAMLLSMSLFKAHNDPSTVGSYVYFSVAQDGQLAFYGFIALIAALVFIRRMVLTRRQAISSAPNEPTP